MPISNPSGQPTKEGFFPVLFGTGDILAGAYGGRVSADCDGLNDIGVVNFSIPLDFQTLTSAVLIVNPGATQAAADWDIKAAYAAVGEAPGIHTEEDAVSTYNVTQNVEFEVDISGILTNLAPGDRGGVSLKQMDAAHHAFVSGMRLKYA